MRTADARPRSQLTSALRHRQRLSRLVVPVPLQHRKWQPVRHRLHRRQ